MSSTSPIVETSIDLDMTPGAVMPVVNASQTDDLRLLTIYLYANGTQYYLYPSSISHEELSIVLNGKKPDGNIFSYECEFDYDSNKVWAYFNKQMTAVAGEVLCELVVYATSTEEEDAEPRQVGSANFVLQVEESPTGGPDSESTLQSLDQIRHELYIATADSRQSAYNAAVSELHAAQSASQAQGAEAAAKNWAVGPSGTGSGTDTNNAKYYSDQASAKYAAFVEATTPIVYKGTWYNDNTLNSKTHTFAEIYAMRDNLTKNSFHLYANGPGDEEITCDYAYITSSMITLQFLYGFNVGATNKLYRIVIQHASDDTVTVTRELLVTYSGLQNGIAEGDGIDITNGVISLDAPQYIVLEEGANGIEQTFSYTQSSPLDQFETDFGIDPISIMELANDKYNVSKLAIRVNNNSQLAMDAHLDRIPIIDCNYSKPDEETELSESIDMTFAFKNKFYRFLINIEYNNEFRSREDVTKVTGRIQSVIPVTPGYGLSSYRHTLSVDHSVFQEKLIDNLGIEITNNEISVKLRDDSGLDFDADGGLYAHVIDVLVDDTSIIDQYGQAQINTMEGATSVGNGSGGLVPEPLVADKDKFLKGDGTWATPTGGGGGDAPIYPISFDVVTPDSFQDITKSSTKTLAKNLPYTGDATSNKKWLDNLRAICDMSKTNTDALSKYVTVRLITDYADDSFYGKVGKKYDCMMEVNPTKVAISSWSTSSAYSLTGRCRFHYFDSADGNLYVDAEWSYNVMYDSATDTYSAETMNVSLTKYS